MLSISINIKLVVRKDVKMKMCFARFECIKTAHTWRRAQTTRQWCYGRSRRHYWAQTRTSSADTSNCAHTSTSSSAWRGRPTRPQPPSWKRPASHPTPPTTTQTSQTTTYRIRIRTLILVVNRFKISLLKTANSTCKSAHQVSDSIWHEFNPY